MDKGNITGKTVGGAIVFGVLLIDALQKALITLMTISIILFPLGIWKAIEIILWIWERYNGN
jgi:hypothetical protein